MNLLALDTFHKTKLGYTVFGLVELGLAFWLANLAINSGSLLQYALVIIFLFGGLQNLVKIFMVRTKHGNKK